MSKYTREQLQQIKSFPSLVKYLRDELEWPITADNFDDLTFDYEPEELGIDSKTAAKIEQIKQLRPLVTNQPWGIFFVKFEPKRLPVVVLRRILSQLVIKKRTSAKKSEQASWNLHDLLFISNYGEGEKRQITFAQFAIDEFSGGSPVLRVLGWDDADTALHLDHVHDTLKEKLQWPGDTSDIEGWRNNWSSAFILRHREVITTSKDLAESLAELAIRIRKRANKVMDIETEKGALQKLYKAFQQALIHDLYEDDFADMYAQTITYGLLASRVSRPMGIVSDNLSDMIPITNPFLKDMLDTFLKVGGKKHKIDFDELGIQEVVELLNSRDTHIEAILRDFGNRTRQEDPVIHFYEFFLSAYDKKKKVERGVFYTPQPVVSFIVRGVHELLKTEFGLEDGLADITTWGEMNNRNKQIIIPQGVQTDEPFVLILDIATGTATFLVEVIDVIYKTMYAKWEKQGKNEKQMAIAWNEYVPKHLLPRLYGFELMMAPYAIAHMKIGLKLAETGYRFCSNERVHVYLTNTLEPHSDVSQLHFFSEALAKEANSVNYIKKNKYFTMVLGNPPYSVSSNNKSDWIEKLTADYKKDLNERNIQPLSDDYIKFIRCGQHLIEKTGEGILAYISNNSFLDGIIHRQMRRNLSEKFDNIFILDLHGNSKKKEVSSDGSSDQNVFDIMQGVSVNIFLKQNGRKKTELSKLFHKDLQGKREYKYEFLNNNVFNKLNWSKLIVNEPSFYFVKKDFSLTNQYEDGFYVNNLFEQSISGIQSGRDNLFVDFDKDVLISRIKRLLTGDIDAEFIKQFNIADSSGYNLLDRIKRCRYSVLNITTISYKPFHKLYIYYDRVLLKRAFYSVFHNILYKNNIGLCLMRSQVNVQDFKTIFLSDTLIDINFFGFQTYFLPLYLYHESTEQNKMDFSQSGQNVCDSNLNIKIANKIAQKLGLNYTLEKGKDTFVPIDLFNYIYAVLHSPSYRAKYNEFLKIDFPRVPYPQDAGTFWQLVILGGELRQLHLLESSKVSQFITTYPKDGSNEVVKVNYKDGKVYINETQYFAGVPKVAWEFYIGGYQPAQKWLKDRKGRKLLKEDIEHYQKIIVALTETDRIMMEIDKIDFLN